jgi:hypothetical protein
VHDPDAGRAGEIFDIGILDMFLAPLGANRLKPGGFSFFRSDLSDLIGRS